MWRPYSPIVSDLPCHWVLSMFVGDVGRWGTTSSHVKNLTAQTWRSTRGWSFSSLTQPHRPLRTPRSSRCRLQVYRCVCVCACVRACVRTCVRGTAIELLPAFGSSYIPVSVTLLICVVKVHICIIVLAVWTCTVFVYVCWHSCLTSIGWWTIQHTRKRKVESTKKKTQIHMIIKVSLLL